MINVSRFCIFLFLLSFSTSIFSVNGGSISGNLQLDDSWERKIHLTYIESFDKEFSISNNSIIASALVDSLGNFKLDLKKIPAHWTLLRIHMVKKGISKNSLIIGSREENFYFLVAKNDSEIKLNNTSAYPIFKNISIEGANYMNAFEMIRKLSTYSNSIDYENSVIEKEFIEEVVSEKLKVIADTCANPLVSLYALYQANFESDLKNDSTFYSNFLLKWKVEKSPYFDTLRLKFPSSKEIPDSNYINIKYILLSIIIGVMILLGWVYYRKKEEKIKTLSIQERKVFDLVRNGLSNKEISAECNIELSTVKSHVSKIYSKLNIKSRKEALNLKLK